MNSSIFVGNNLIADCTSNNVQTTNDRVTSFLGKVVHCKRINKVRYSVSTKDECPINNHYCIDKIGVSNFVDYYINRTYLASDNDEDFEI